MKRLFLVLLLCVLSAVPFEVHADVAPPLNPPGTNPVPGLESTQVRMVAETVLIDVKDDREPGSLGTADVTADFTMRNLGEQDERMAVRFPVSGNDGRDQYPSLTGLVVKVDGKQVSTRRTSYPDLRFPTQSVPWIEFDVIFPAGQDVEIGVRYGLQGSGYAPYAAYYYVLETGAGWKGTIGSADITLRMPYPASSQNIVLDLQIGWAETTVGGVIRENEMQWHFEDFEPGPGGVITNMEFAIVAPVEWQAVLEEREAVSKAASDGEAWGRLGKAYKGIFFMNKGFREDPGGAELYLLSAEAYEHCLALLPNDAQWHAGFGDLLTSHAYWDYAGTGLPNEMYRGLEEIHTALQMAPKDAKVLEMAEKIYWMFPEAMPTSEAGYDFVWLTQTPTPRSSHTPAAAIQATVTPQPTHPAPTETLPPATAPARAPNPLFHACGSAALVPIAVLLGAFRKRRP